jgi:hypothetical protein
MQIPLKIKINSVVGKRQKIVVTKEEQALRQKVVNDEKLFRILWILWKREEVESVHLFAQLE